MILNFRKGPNYSAVYDNSYMDDDSDSLRDFTLFTNRDTKNQLENEAINREVDRTLSVRRGLRSLKYRNNNFDWKAMESLNGGEALFEIIVTENK
jgi:hypothetical protein